MDNLYLQKLNNIDNDIIKKIHDNSKDLNIPIIKDDGLDFLLTIVKLVKPKRILEIGTAVGFSSIMMALNSDSVIDTIEKKKEMYDKALSNIKLLNLDNRITVHLNDGALVPFDELKDSYDLIFIDAAKAQYRKYFERYEGLLTNNGVIICDNILFHGFVESYDNNTIEASKDLKALARKIDTFNKWLANNDKYITRFINVGDGLAVSVKK